MIATPKTLLQLETLLDHIAYFNNGLNFSDFKEMVDNDLTDVAIANAFGRDRRTISKWRKVYQNERNSTAT